MCKNGELLEQFNKNEKMLQRIYDEMVNKYSAKILEVEQQLQELVKFVNIVEKYFGPYTNSSITRENLYKQCCELQDKYKGE